MLKNGQYLKNAVFDCNNDVELVVWTNKIYNDTKLYQNESLKYSFFLQSHRSIIWKRTF